MNMSQTCNTSQLQPLIGCNTTKILDCSWFLPTQNKDPEREFRHAHIAGAQFFDIDKICDQTTDLPHMLPSETDFTLAVSALGINSTDTVIAYDSAGLFSAARVWWMFKVFGHESVRVLEGGLPAWIAAGGQISSVSETPIAGNFTAAFQPELVATKAQLISNCESHEYVVLDARSSARFLGQAPEPRPGLPSGHMPNAISLPFNELVEGGKLKPREELSLIFSDHGVTKSSRVVTSCGSGVTAAIITLAMAECGLGLKRLYDGAWAEWGSARDTIILDRSPLE